MERLAGSATYCEREVGWLAEQLLTAVAHLHANAIVHMDIKPDNLVFATRCGAGGGTALRERRRGRGRAEGGP